MATPNIPMQQNNLSDITDLVSLFKSLPTLTNSSGTKTTGPSSTTTKTDITTEGIQAILQSVLSGTSGIPGLAALTQGQKSAGMYNSTVNQQLSNDLLSRVGSEVAVKSMGTTVTNSGNTVTDSASQSVGKTPPLTGSTILQGAVGLGTNALLKKGYKSLEELLGGESSATSVASAASESMIGSPFTGGTVTADTQSLLSAASPRLEASIFGPAGEAGEGGLAEAISSGSEFIGPLELGAYAAGTGGVTAGSAALGLGSSAAAAGAGLLEGSAAGYASSGALAGGAVEGAAGIGEAAVASEGIGEAIATAIALWVVCTELHKQGRMPTRYYIPGAKWFAGYPSNKKCGYYIWAIPAVRHLRSKPHSALSNFLCYVFNERAKMIAFKSGHSREDSAVGHVTELILYPTCWILGSVINMLGISEKFNPASLYTTAR